MRYSLFLAMQASKLLEGRGWASVRTQRQALFGGRGRGKQRWGRYARQAGHEQVWSWVGRHASQREDRHHLLIAKARGFVRPRGRYGRQMPSILASQCMHCMYCTRPKCVLITICQETHDPAKLPSSSSCAYPASLGIG